MNLSNEVQELDKKREKDESKNNKVGFIISVILHCLLIFFCIYSFAWIPPDPPIPTYGIEVDFGISETGSGDEPVSDPNNDLSQNTEATNDAKSSNVNASSTNSNNHSTETSDYKEDIETSDNDPDAPNMSKSTPEDNKKDQSSDNHTNSSSTTNSNANNSSSNNSSNTNSSNGKSTNDNGDQGKTDGQLNKDATLGKATGKGGASLEIAGWKWDSEPKIVDESAATGSIVYEFQIDADGNIEYVRILSKSSGIPFTVANTIKEQLEEQLSFSRTKGNTSNQAFFKGKITYVITSK